MGSVHSTLIQFNRIALVQHTELLDRAVFSSKQWSYLLHQ